MLKILPAFRHILLTAWFKAGHSHHFFIVFDDTHSRDTDYGMRYALLADTPFILGILRCACNLYLSF